MKAVTWGFRGYRPEGHAPWVRRSLDHGSLSAFKELSMAKGVDARSDCSGIAQALVDAGVEFVARYYANSGAKVLSQGEARMLSLAGLQLVAVWEDGYPTKALYFSYAKGVDDASSAFHDALIVGQPIDSPIYFAVDYDATNSDISGPINDYFRGIAAGFAASSGGGSVHPVGVYGSGATCSFLLARNLAAVSWLSMSPGFLGSKYFGAWNIKQTRDPQQFGGIAADLDESVGNYGGFQVG